MGPAWHVKNSLLIFLKLYRFYNYCDKNELDKVFLIKLQILCGFINLFTNIWKKQLQKGF